jgi:protein TonB
MNIFFTIATCMTLLQSRYRILSSLNSAVLLLNAVLLLPVLGSSSGIAQANGNNVKKTAPALLPSEPATSPAVPVRKVEPEYSEEARVAGLEGNVELRVEIDAAGRVTNVQVTRSLGMGLDEQAMESAKEWLFKPAVKDGHPIASSSAIRMNFRLL